MNTLKTFQNMVLRLMVIIVPPLGLGAWFFSPVFATGFMFGVAAGGLWLALKLAQGRSLIRGYRRGTFFFLLGGVFPILFGAAALYIAHIMDMNKVHGCFGVLAGLLLVQAVILLIGITGWDLRVNSVVETTPPGSSSETQ